MKIQGENVSFTGLEVNWTNELPQWRDPSLRGLVQRMHTIRLEQSLEIGGFADVPQKAVQYALKHGGEFECEFHKLIFGVEWLKTYLTELSSAETEPLVVHTTAEPLELRRLRFAAHKAAAHKVRILMEDDIPVEDMLRVVHDEPHTWLDDLQKPITDDPDTTATNVVWNSHLYELRATNGIRHAIDQHFGTEPQPFSPAP